MKNIKNIFSGVLLSGIAVALTLSSCQKKFDAKTYAPNKPLPSFGGYNSSAEIEPASLVSYFPFTSSFADSLGALSGTTKGTLSLGAGISGKGFQGAVSSYQVFNNVAAIKSLSSFTVSFWMNSPKEGGLARGIFSLNNPADFWGSLDIYIDGPTAADKNGDTLIFKVHMNNASGVPYGAYFLQSKVPNAINKWVHMVVTYDETTSKIDIFENAAEIGIAGVAGTSGFVMNPVMPGDDPTKIPKTLWGPIKFPSPTAAVMGTWQFQTDPSLTASATAQTWAESFTGGLDNFRIYSKALSSAEVSALYNLESLGR